MEPSPRCTPVAGSMQRQKARWRIVRNCDKIQGHILYLKVERLIVEVKDRSKFSTWILSLIANILRNTTFDGRF